MLWEDFIAVGLPVLRIQFFRQQQRSLLLASPAVASLTASSASPTTADAAAWAAGDGDLDFVLCDANADPTLSRERSVDYQFLLAHPMPARRAGESCEERSLVLKRWMEACYLQHSSARLATSLRDAASPLLAEFETCLSTVAAPGGRRVGGVVLPAREGGSTVALVVPLLGSRDEAVRRTLTEISMLYAKALRCPWEAKAHTITRAELDLHVTLHTAAPQRLSGSTGGGRGPHGRQHATMQVLSERLTMRLYDGCGASAAPSSASSPSSFVPLLQACLDQRGLLGCGSSFERGHGFTQYLPRLEAALYRSLREPLHFLKLTIALSASLGEPVDVSVAAHDMDSCGDGQALVKTASYSVVDRASRCSFMVGIHYHGGTVLPSVGVVCAQYLAPSHESLLRLKISYPANTEKTLTTNVDGMFDIPALAAVMATCIFETMAFLLTLCQ